jgi:hypothetical protein
MMSLFACEVAGLVALLVAFPHRPNQPGFVPVGLAAEDMRQVSALVRAAEWRFILSIWKRQAILNLPHNLWYSRSWSIAVPPNLLTEPSFLSPTEFPVIIVASDGKKTQYFAKYWAQKQRGHWRVSACSQRLP